jgi:hypothetical protein
MDHMRQRSVDKCILMERPTKMLRRIKKYLGGAFSGRFGGRPRQAVVWRDLIRPAISA